MVAAYRYPRPHHALDTQGSRSCMCFWEEPYWVCVLPSKLRGLFLYGMTVGFLFIYCWYRPSHSLGSRTKVRRRRKETPGGSLLNWCASESYRVHGREETRTAKACHWRQTWRTILSFSLPLSFFLIWQLKVNTQVGRHPHRTALGGWSTRYCYRAN